MHFSFNQVASNWIRPVVQDIRLKTINPRGLASSEIVDALCGLMNQSNLNNPVDDRTRALLNHIIYKAVSDNYPETSNSTKTRDFVKIIQGSYDSDPDGGPCVGIRTDQAGRVSITRKRTDPAGRVTKKESYGRFAVRNL